MPRVHPCVEPSNGKRASGTAGHGFLSKEVMTSAFPKLAAWHQQWSAALGRDVSYAVFHSEGPWDTLVRDGVSVHFRDTDWIVHRVP